MSNNFNAIHLHCQDFPSECSTIPDVIASPDLSGRSNLKGLPRSRLPSLGGQVARNDGCRVGKQDFLGLLQNGRVLLWSG
jgi:hypothetical protein